MNTSTSQVKNRSKIIYLLIAGWALWIVGVGVCFAQAEQSTANRTITLMGRNADGEISCPIQFSDSNGGHFRGNTYAIEFYAHPKGDLGQLSLSLSCVKIEDADGGRAIHGVGYDARERRWVTVATDNSAQDAEVPQPSMRLFPIQASNSVGIGVTQDATSGDRPMRAFFFCLRHPPVALCGWTPQVMHLGNKKSDLMPMTLDIVKSITFFETPLSNSTRQ